MGGLATRRLNLGEWEDFRDHPHLEDKVSFPGDGNVSNSSSTMDQEARPRRQTSRPKYLEDYV